MLVCENGYLGVDGAGHQLYAISEHGHNGSGWFPIGTEDRFSGLGVEVKPWRAAGEHVLVCAQRGIGSCKMRSPSRWDAAVVAEVQRLTKREVRLRPHPGRHAGKPLEDDLRGAHACVIWSSSSGVRALVEGIPVVRAAPWWICSEAAVRSVTRVNMLLLDDTARANALHKMSHGQWTLAEIESGEPFKRILEGLKHANRLPGQR